MQGNSPWYTPPSSALHNEPSNSNYFYNYGHHWNRPTGNYDPRYYPNQQQQQQLYMNNMRACGDNYVSTSNSAQHPPHYECPPSGYFRANSSDYDSGPNVRSRTRTQHADVSQNNFEKSKNPRMNAKPNDTETENFSSVFTQSLTSLYSQDVDGNFVEEKTFADGGSANASASCIKIKTEEPDCNNEYGFNTVFNVDSQNSASSNFETVKIKQEPFSRDDGPQYDGYSLDDMYVRRRRGTLAEAYSRKRKHSVPTTAYGSSMGVPTTDDKSPRLFQPDCQWIPNSVGTCDENSKNSYQSEFSERYQSYDPTRINKKQPVKPRVTRGRNENGELKSPSSCKKIPKKVSPLTVYVKVVDDRIVDVTCRRYKKRSKPKINSSVVSEDCIVLHENNQAAASTDSWTDLYDVVGGVLRNLVDDVVYTVEQKDKDIPDLSKMHPMKVKELLHRFCYDYSLDYRDFTDVDEIIRSVVTTNKDESSSRKRRSDRVQNIDEQPKINKRGKSSDKEESLPRKVEAEKVTEEIVEKVEETIPEEKSVSDDKPTESAKSKPLDKPKGKPKATKNVKQLQQQASESPEPRVLRSLPSRQPRPVSKKTRGKRKKNRYPKRNLRSKKQPTGRVGRKKMKILIDISKDNDTAEVLEMESDSNHSVGKSNAKSDVESEGETEVVKEQKETKVVKEIEDNKNTLENEDEDTKSSVINDNEESLTKVKEEILEDDEEEDFGLRQPPQLVRMTDESNGFQEENSEKESKSTLIEYPENNGQENSFESSPPPTLQPTVNHPQIPVHKDAPVVETDKEHKHHKSELNDKDNFLNETEAFQTTAVPIQNGQVSAEPVLTNGTSQIDSTSEDECIIVCNEDPKQPVEDIKESKPFDPISTLKEQLLKKPIFDKNSEDLDVKTLDLSRTLKSITKDEHDESILRTLLLESEAVSNSGIVKELESSGAPSPIIANILNSAGRDALSAINIEVMKSPDLSLGHLSNDSNIDIESLRATKFSAPYSDAYINSLSPETYEDAQKHFKGSLTPPLSQIIPKCEPKDSVEKDPQQLKDKIKKLKNEIVYLQLMAEQKEKEKIAIVCFKRYKEEILKRIYKAYAFSVQDHVRDWIFAKREGTAENRSGCNSSSNSLKPPSPSQRSDNSRIISETSKGTISDGFRDGSYSSSSLHIPQPSTSSSSLTSNRSQSIHSSQKTNVSKEANVTATTSSNEKVSTVETMVAKASQNYGLDMTNLRERLRCSPSESSSGTILQKALSQNSSRNPTPDHSAVSRSWSPGKHSKKSSSISSRKTNSPIVPKPYLEHYNIPLDRMKMNHNEVRSSKGPDLYNSSDTPRSAHNVPEKTQMLSLMPEPIEIKAHRNPYRNWCMQAGGRIGEDRSSYSKPVIPSVTIPSTSTGHDTIESPLQRQLNSNKVLPVPNFSIPVPNASYNISSHRTSVHNKSEKSHGHSEKSSRTKKIDEDRRQLSYESSFAPIPSSMPFCGPAIDNNCLATNLSLDKPRSPPPRSSPPMCMGCGLMTAKFICSGCRKHWYCSSRCQSLIWPEHSRVCEVRPFPQTPGPYP